MWVPKEVADWFQISKDSVDTLRTELATLKVERDVLKDQLRGAQINSDWLRMQVNSLQMERAGLMEKAYNIRVPIPELARTTSLQSPISIEDFSFTDIGDEAARKLGLPLYGIEASTTQSLFESN